MLRAATFALNENIIEIKPGCDSDGNAITKTGIGIDEILCCNNIFVEQQGELNKSNQNLL
jgi:hypothetical protein